jgi:hypothetical protein
MCRRGVVVVCGLTVLALAAFTTQALAAKQRSEPRLQLSTPASAGPVSLPYVERPPDPPQRVPHPLPNGAGN